MPETELPLIRHPLLTGRQLIAGLWFAADHHDEPARQRLILEQWQPGANVHRFAEGDLLRFASSRWAACEAMLGWPLIRNGRGLSSAPLTPQELRALPPADCWLVRGSQLSALHLRDGVELAPGGWIDIQAYTLLDTLDCQASLQAPVPDPLPVSTDVREILGEGWAAPSPERGAVMQALREAHAQAASSAPAPAGEAASARLRQGQGAAGGARRPSMGLWARVGLMPLVLVAALAGLLLRFTSSSGRSAKGSAGRPFDGAAAHSPFGNGPSTADAGSLAPRATPSAPEPSRWRRWLTRLALSTRLAELYGRRQADYLRRMLDLFENGDLEEALRHAIPLGGETEGEEQSFGTPGRRENLEISAHRAPARSMVFGGDLQSTLQQVYRQSFQRLDREGRIDEAAFVLAELLNARQEALDYLEKHGRHRQAAELALSWDMPAATIVRLLCLADDWARAVLVARRDNAFADAVLLLQKKWPELADRLRLEWAESLTDKGLWLQAVDVIWPLPAERQRATQWLLNAEAAGGTLAVGALVKRAILLPDTLSACGPWIEQLRDDPGRASERAALAQALLQQQAHGQALAWLAGAVVRAVLADHARGPGPLSQAQLRALVGMSRDKQLEVDLPSGPPPLVAVKPLDGVVEPLHWSAPDMGSRAISDAVLLDDGRYLLALGEAGVLVVDAAGKPLFHFPVPAQKIVLAHSRQMVLVLARRSAVWRIGKLDLVNRRATDLGVLMLDVFAQSFDGTAWTIGQGRNLRVVDVDRRFATLWHVGDLPGQIVGMLDDAQSECLLLMEPDSGLQLWHYRLPERRLTRRDSIPECTDEADLLISAAGATAEYRVQGDVGAAPVLVLQQNGRSRGYRLTHLDHALTAHFPVSLSLFEPWLMIRYLISGGQTRWQFIHGKTDQLCAVLDWPTPAAQLRHLGADWLVFDDQGRLSHINVDAARQHNLSIN